MEEYIPRQTWFPPVSDRVRKILVKHYREAWVVVLPYQENTRKCIRCGGRDYVEEMVESSRTVGSKYYHCQKCWAEKATYGGRHVGRRLT